MQTRAEETIMRHNKGYNCAQAVACTYCVLAGMKNSSGNLDTPNSKGSTYALSREIVKQFGEQNGSVVCKTLKGVDSGKVLRPCQDCIKDAAAIAEQVLFSES